MPTRAEKREQSRKARRESQRNLKHLEENKAKLKADATSLQAFITDTDKNFTKNVHDHRDARPDAKLLTEQTKLGLEIVEDLPLPSSRLNSDGFIKALRKMGEFQHDGNFDWQALGQNVGVYWRTAPSVTVFKGALNLKRKKRPKRGKAAHDVLGEEKRPDNQLKKKATVESKAAEKRDLKLKRELQRLMKDAARTSKLHAGGGKIVEKPRLPMLETLVDPNSFSKTVEDMFYTSFLVMRNTATLDVDVDTQQPVFAPVTIASTLSAPAAGSKGDGKSADTEDGAQVPGATAADTYQNVVSIDMERWLQMRRAFKIRKAALPHVVKDVPQDLAIAKDRENYPYRPKGLKRQFIDTELPDTFVVPATGAGDGDDDGEDDIMLLSSDDDDE